MPNKCINMLVLETFSTLRTTMFLKLLFNCIENIVEFLMENLSISNLVKNCFH